jgi:hypothetical protein
VEGLGRAASGGHDNLLRHDDGRHHDQPAHLIDVAS